MISYLKRHHVALLALLVAMSGTAYAATEFIEAPPGGAGDVDFGRASVKPVGFVDIVTIPGLGVVEGRCFETQPGLVVAFKNNSGRNLEVWDNIGSTDRTVIADQAVLFVLQVNVSETELGQIQIFKAGAKSASATVEVGAAGSETGTCRFIAQYLRAEKPS